MELATLSKRQLGSSLRMLSELVEICPEGIWSETHGANIEYIEARRAPCYHASTPHSYGPYTSDYGRITRSTKARFRRPNPLG